MKCRIDAVMLDLWMPSSTHGTVFAWTSCCFESNAVWEIWCMRACLRKETRMDVRSKSGLPFPSIQTWQLFVTSLGILVFFYRSDFGYSCVFLLILSSNFSIRWGRRYACSEKQCRQINTFHIEMNSVVMSVMSVWYVF